MLLKPQFLILNKIDLIKSKSRFDFLKNLFPNGIYVSALDQLRIESLKKSIFSKLGYFLAKKSLEGFRAHMDPRKYNGAVFLGLNGVVVKSHGGTDSFGFANAIGVAYDMAKYNFIEDLKKKLSITTKHLI